MKHHLFMLALGITMLAACGNTISNNTDVGPTDGGIDIEVDATIVDISNLSAPRGTTLLNVVNSSGQDQFDTPDPTVFMATGEDGKMHYYMSHTVSDHRGDLPLYTSEDLVTWKQTGTLFGCSTQSGSYCQVNASNTNGFVIEGQRFCHVWGPDVAQDGDRFVLTFSSVVVPESQNCPSGYNDNANVFVARSIAGSAPIQFQFAGVPQPIATAPDCPDRANKVMSVSNQDRPREGVDILKNIYIDNSIYRDQSGQPWLVYTWNTNLYKYPNFTDLERQFYGVHSAIAKLDKNNITQLQCEDNTPINVANAKSPELLAQLRSSCDGCNQMLSLQGHVDAAVHPENFAVAEGGSTIFHNGRYYMFFSGSSWTSVYYNVFWISATTIEGLEDGAPGRRAGRYLVPSAGHGVGHGHPIKGSNDKWYYLYHHLDERCRKEGYCPRNAVISPIDFDAAGDVVTVFPVEDLGVGKSISERGAEHLQFEAQLKDENSGLCVTLRDVTTQAGGGARTDVRLDTCVGTDNQIFWFDPVEWDSNFDTQSYYQIKSRAHEGTCLTVNGASLFDGENVLAYPCLQQNISTQVSSLGNQYFKGHSVDGRIQLELGHAGNPKQCLTVDQAGTSPGANLIQFQCIDWPPNTVLGPNSPKNALFTLLPVQ